MPDMRIYNEANIAEWPKGWTWCDLTMCPRAGPHRGNPNHGFHICEYHWHILHTDKPYEYDVENGCLVVKAK